MYDGCEDYFFGYEFFQRLRMLEIILDIILSCWLILVEAAPAGRDSPVAAPP